MQPPAQKCVGGFSKSLTERGTHALAGHMFMIAVNGLRETLLSEDPNNITRLHKKSTSEFYRKWIFYCRSQSGIYGQFRVVSLITPPCPASAGFCSLSNYPNFLRYNNESVFPSEMGSSGGLCSENFLYFICNCICKLRMIFSIQMHSVCFRRFRILRRIHKVESVKLCLFL